MDATTPPPVVQTPPPPATPQRVRILPIIRDVVIIWILTAMGGFVVGLASGPSHDAERFMMAVAVSNFLLGTVGFTISGCLAPPGRWRHLALVALGVWLTSLINVILFGFTIPEWIGVAVFTGITMGLGGSISYIFKREAKPSA